MKWFLGILLSLVALGFMTAGTWRAWDQHQALSRAVKVQATVTSSEVKVTRGRKSSSYKPMVYFTFELQGQRCSGERVTYLNSSSTRSWAYEIVKSYRPGHQVDAWVDPTRPEYAFLLREHEFLPYGLLLVPMVYFLLATLFFSGIIGEGRTRMLAVPLGAGSLLLPAVSLRRKLRGAVGTLAMWTAVGAAGGGHYLLVTEQVSLTAMIILGIYAAVTAVPLWLVWKYRSLASHLSEPRVTVQPVPAALGERITIDVEFDAYTPLRVREVRAAVTCVEHYREKRGNKTYFGTRIKARMDAAAGGPQEVMAGGIVTGSAEFTMPAGEPASSPGKKVYPWHHWQVEAQVKLEGAADYKGVFPLEVREGSALPAQAIPDIQQAAEE